MEPFTDAVGLGMVGLGPRLVNVLDGQVALVGVVLEFPAVLGAPVGEDPIELDTLGIKEGDHPIVEQVGRGDGALVGVELAGGHPAVDVDEGLLVDASQSPLGGYSSAAPYSGSDPGYVRSLVPSILSSSARISPSHRHLSQFSQAPPPKLRQ